MEYSLSDGEYYKVIDADSGDMITFDRLTDGVILSTINVVEFITKDEYDALLALAQL